LNMYIDTPFALPLPADELGELRCVEVDLLLGEEWRAAGVAMALAGRT